MMQRVPTEETRTLDIAGSSTFGAYPKISIAQTWNMFLSDGWLIPYGGNRLRVMTNANGVGRGCYTSYRGNFFLAVIGDAVFTMSSNLHLSQVGTLNTIEGNVSIAENEKSEIAICDGSNIWIYNYFAGTFIMANTSQSDGTHTPFLPTYVCYQKGFFIAGAANITPIAGNAGWRLCDINNSLDWPFDAQHVGGFLTKADNVIAVIPFPGGSNLLYVVGHIVIEPWYNLGLALFPYSLQQYNIDYGVIQPATFDYNENIVVWIGQNEKSQIVLMYSTGQSPQTISTDGINNVLNNLTKPQDSFGFLFKQNGHLFYQFTFPTDNVSYMYDFSNDKFYNLSDENINYHPARAMSLFDNRQFFVSNKDNGIYEFDQEIPDYNFAEIPRIRRCSPVRLPNNDPFLVNNIQFTMEQGNDDVYWNNEASLRYPNSANIRLPKLDLSCSYDGGITFSAADSIELNPIGLRQNRVSFYQMGYANDFTPEFRFKGFSRFLATSGTITIY